MQPELVNTVICPRCHAELATSAAICEHCGAAVTGAGAHDEANNVRDRASKKPWRWRTMIDTRWSMLLLLFCVTLFLGLPLLWNSRAFTPAAKVIVTIAVLVWTAVVFWAFYALMASLLPGIIESWNAIMHG